MHQPAQARLSAKCSHVILVAVGQNIRLRKEGQIWRLLVGTHCRVSFRDKCGSRDRERPAGLEGANLLDLWVMLWFTMTPSRQTTPAEFSGEWQEVLETCLHE
jgi:hypothetical protein